MPEAFYRFRAEIVRRNPDKRGMKSALVAAAYRSGQRLEFEREDQVIDYSRRSGVLHTEILAPDHAPGWMHNREDLWNVIEGKEKRCDARLARDFTLALPYQLNREQMQEAVTGFLQKQFVSRGLVCDMALHAPHEAGDTRNYHAHVLVTERPITEAGFTQKKDRGLNERGKITEWRQAWQDQLNRIFERDQIRDRKGELYFVDHRSYKERGIDKEPTRHLGPDVTALERQGIATDAGDYNRQVNQRNQQRDKLRGDLEAIQEEIALAERQQEKAQRLFGDERTDAPGEQRQLTEDVQDRLEAEERQREKYRRLFGDEEVNKQQAQQAEERRKEKLRLMFGDQVDTTQTEADIRLRRQSDVRDRYDEVGARIDDADLAPRPKPRELGVGMEGPGS